MRHHIRDFIYRRLIIAILICGITAGAGVTICAVLLLDRIIISSNEAAYRDAADRFTLFDLLVYRIEAETRVNGRRALVELARRYPTLEAAAVAGMDRLRNDARELGVSEVYFISSDFKVLATSFPPDLGLDFTTFTYPEFVDFLKAQFGSGRFADQRITQSIMTAEVNSYQYHGPAGADFIIEVSTRFDDAVPRILPGKDYASLVRLAFSLQDAPQGLLVHFADCVFMNPKTVNSIVSSKDVDPWIADLVRRAEAGGGEAQADRGFLVVKVRRLQFALRDFDYADLSYAVLEFDRRPLWYFLLVSAAAALLAGAGVAGLSFLAVRRSLVRRFTRRLEGLERAMADVGAGRDAGTLDDGGEDEISSIGSSAAAMVAELRARSAELSAFARRLEEEIHERERREAELSTTLEENRALVHEVNHRVKNNLQVMISLVALQSQASRADETKDALRRMQTRLYAISLVQDQVLRTPSLVNVDMQEMLDDLVVDVWQAHASSGKRILATVDAGGLSRPADKAVSIGLAVSELVDNAYRHAFDGRSEGIVRVTIRSGVGNGYVLEVADDGNGRLKPGGVGLEIVAALAAQLGGKMETGTAAGSVVRIVVDSPA
ncbi:MAG: hypothetical protein NT080_07780 [Spirochaetes bacterium]|nr:hypothetical protein [Spirochaetota bacterium]